MKLYEDFEFRQENTNFMWKGEENHYLVWLDGYTINFDSNNRMSVNPIYRSAIHFTKLNGYPTIEFPWAIVIFVPIPPFVVIKKPEGVVIEKV